MSILKKIARAREGAVTIYVALFSIAGIAGAGLAIDYGRMVVLHQQLQDSADARALAAAVQLDGLDDARVRAEDLATGATTDRSSIGIDSDPFIVDDVNFYSEINPNFVVATDDINARFVEVILKPEDISLLFRPILDLVRGRSAIQVRSVNAQAVAGPEPFICEAPPLMICDFSEVDPADDLRDPANYGRQVRLKHQGASGTWAPGNFGLLSLPDGSGGANVLAASLAAVTPPQCFGEDVTTATGSKTNKIADAINARFDMDGNSWPYPAENVINYPRDSNIVADETVRLGDGNWNRSDYWTDTHATGLPGDLVGATRYQTYLYELGLEFGKDGHSTYYPVTPEMPADFTTITPPAPDIPSDPSDPYNNDVDGVPNQATASNGYARRLIQVAQLQCVSEDVKGKGTYPTDANYVELFITETVADPPEADIFGEVVRSLSASNLPEFHANVRLFR